MLEGKRIAILAEDDSEDARRAWSSEAEGAPFPPGRTRPRQKTKEVAR